MPRELKTDTVHIRLDDSQKEMLEKLAEYHVASFSDIIRRLIVAEYRSLPKKQE